ERRTAAPPRHARRARLRPRGRPVPPPGLLGRDVEDQRHRPALARPGVPIAARARDLVLPRVHQPSAPENAARILAALRSAAAGSRDLAERREAEGQEEK